MNWFVPFLFQSFQSPVARQGVGVIPPSTPPTNTTTPISFPIQSARINNNNNNNNFLFPSQFQRPRQTGFGARRFQRPRPSRRRPTRRPPLSFEFVPTRLPSRLLPPAPPRANGLIPIREFLRHGPSSIVAGCHLTRRVPCTTEPISRSTCERWRCCWSALDAVPCSQNTFFVTQLISDDFTACGSPIDSVPVAPAAPPIPPLLLNLIRPRIIGGVEATPGEWPWMAYLYTLDASEPDGGIRNNGLCGGSLVTDRWVVTAAHCIVTSDPTLYGVVLGAHSISQLTGEEEIRNVKQILSIMLYDSVTFNFDVALLELDRPVTFNQFIRPICVVPQATPTDSNVSPSFAGMNCIVLGWGLTAQNPDVRADVLMRVDIPIVPRQVCTILVGSNVTQYGNRPVNPNDPKFCAGGTMDTRDSCSGDSGGPLFCLHDDGRYFLHGIVSYGTEDCGTGLPGIYTLVSHPAVNNHIIANAFVP